MSRNDPNTVRMDVKLGLQIIYRSLHVDEPENPDLSRQIDYFIGHLDAWPRMDDFIRTQILYWCTHAGSFYHGCIHKQLFRNILEEFAWRNAFSLAREFEFFLPSGYRVEMDGEDADDPCVRLLEPNPPGRTPEWETMEYGLDPEVRRRIREERLAGRVREWQRGTDID